MKHSDYLSKSKYGFPKKGVKGVESDWLEFGEVDIPTGSLWIGDATVLNSTEGRTVKVPPGRYVVQLKGMDFKGVRTFSRVRAFAVNCERFSQGDEIGEVITDSSMIGICDIAAVDAAVTKRYMAEFENDLREATAEPGSAIDTFAYGKKNFMLAYVPSGLGDGAFPVYSLEASGGAVGVEVEFLPSDYVHDA
jgi:hypothetical protein